MSVQGRSSLFDQYGHGRTNITVLFFFLFNELSALERQSQIRAVVSRAIC